MLYLTKFHIVNDGLEIRVQTISYVFSAEDAQFAHLRNTYSASLCIAFMTSPCLLLSACLIISLELNLLLTLLKKKTVAGD